MNKYEKLFEEFMDLTEFTLVKYKEPNEDGEIWGLWDRQGANLGGIEDNRFSNAAQIFERMEIYINDYILESLSQYYMDCIDCETNYEFNYWSAEEWLSHRDELEGINEDFTYDLDLLDMICYHSEEIDLNNVYYAKENDKGDIEL